MQRVTATPRWFPPPPFSCLLLRLPVHEAKTPSSLPPHPEDQMDVSALTPWGIGDEIYQLSEGSIGNTCEDSGAQKDISPSYSTSSTTYLSRLLAYFAHRPIPSHLKHYLATTCRPTHLHALLVFVCHIRGCRKIIVHLAGESWESHR